MKTNLDLPERPTRDARTKDVRKGDTNLHNILGTEIESGPIKHKIRILRAPTFIFSLYSRPDGTSSIDCDVVKWCHFLRENKEKFYHLRFNSDLVKTILSICSYVILATLSDNKFLFVIGYPRSKIIEICYKKYLGTSKEWMTHENIKPPLSAYCVNPIYVSNLVPANSAWLKVIERPPRPIFHPFSSVFPSRPDVSTSSRRLDVPPFSRVRSDASWRLLFYFASGTDWKDQFLFQRTF